MLAVYAIDLTPREAYRRSPRGIITVENFFHTQDVRIHKGLEYSRSALTAIFSLLFCISL